MCLIGSCLAGVAAVIALAERSRIPEGGWRARLTGSLARLHPGLMLRLAVGKPVADAAAIAAEIVHIRLLGPEAPKAPPRSG